MKRFFIFAICFLSLQIVKAHSLTLIDTSLRMGHGDYPEKTTDDAVLPAHVNASSNSIFKLRLDSIQKDIQLDYNDYVQSYIDIYTRHKDEMSHVLGLAKYYFPIYEKVFREAGIPTEIKYLSIVESKLDPNAVSKVGATGPWQFMSTTAKIYGLNMDSYVDDRRDPIKASYAAAAYLKDAYQEFGDWLLAIASYNCGKSNVERAIEKAGANDFWSIRQYLPAETRGYVPAYIAISYVMNYANKHNINTQNWDLSAKTDTVFVDKYISLSNVAKALNVDLTELSLLNPAYSRKIVNGTAVYPRRIIIPDVDKWNYSALYDALDGVNIPFAVKPPKPVVPVIVKAVVPASAPPVSGGMVMVQPTDQPEFHKVKRGETLVDIASNYGVDISDIKAWNHLHGNRPVVGQVLKLTPM